MKQKREEDDMPYIRQNRRGQLEDLLVSMMEHSIVADGDLNYLLYTYFYRYRPMSYDRIKNYCGELRQCATEIERTLLGPYEDEKIKEYGGIE